jgi:hypothetical protein
VLLRQVIVAQESPIRDRPTAEQRRTELVAVLDIDHPAIAHRTPPDPRLFIHEIGQE